MSSPPPPYHSVFPKTVDTRPFELTYTDLRVYETTLPCGICFDHLKLADGSEPREHRVVQTNCECTRENQIFHAACYAKEMLRNHKVLDSGRVTLLCPFARHKINAGVLQETFDSLFKLGSPDRHSAPRRLSFSSTSSDKKEEKPASGDSGTLHRSHSFNSLSDLSPKAREVYEMLNHFGEPGHRTYRSQKQWEVYGMNDEFGRPRRRPFEEREWKGSYYTAVHDRIDDDSLGSQSVLINLEDTEWGSYVGADAGAASPFETQERAPTRPPPEPVEEDVVRVQSGGVEASGSGGYQVTDEDRELINFYRQFGKSNK